MNFRSSLKPRKIMFKLVYHWIYCVFNIWLKSHPSKIILFWFSILILIFFFFGRSIHSSLRHKLILFPNHNTTYRYTFCYRNNRACIFLYIVNKFVPYPVQFHWFRNMTIDLSTIHWRWVLEFPVNYLYICFAAVIMNSIFFSSLLNSFQSLPI